VPSTFLGQDNATSGSWIGVYGSDAWDIAGDTSSPNPFATVVMSQHNTYTYEYPSIDPRAPYLGSNPTQRIACVWYNDVSIDINVTVKDGSSHKLSIYALDWDRNGVSPGFLPGWGPDRPGQGFWPIDHRTRWPMGMGYVSFSRRLYSRI
jgi:hypothetical protein